MPFDSEEKRSDFAKWAEEMSYEEEKELKRQEKIRLKEEKKAAKKAKKSGKKEDVQKDINKEDSEETAVDSSVNETEKSEKETVEKEAVEKETSEGKKDKAIDETIPKEDSSEEQKDKQEINIVKELLSLIIYIGIVIIICYCIITYVGQRTTVNGQSMENTLKDGDNLWIDKFTYHFRDPKRFDIVVFPYQDEDVYYIKRIIGLPGETVQITSDGAILIDGQRLSESYGKEVIFDSGTASEPHTLGEDEYFVLGDNRNDSRDSRWADVGDIDRDEIVGKAVIRLTPLKKFGKIDKDD